MPHTLLTPRAAPFGGHARNCSCSTSGRIGTIAAPRAAAAGAGPARQRTPPAAAAGAGGIARRSPANSAEPQSRAAAVAVTQRQQQQQQREEGTGASGGSGLPTWCEELALAAATALALAPPVLADEAVAEAINYNATAGDGLVKGLSGILYLGLLGFFFYRTFNRRARQAREERIAGQGPIRTIFTDLIEKSQQRPDKPKATPLSCLIGAAQAGAIAFGLFIFTTKVEGSINAQSLPDAYTARNIAITVRTIIIGLLYLVTFIFSANTVGLTGLAFQMAFFPDSLKEDEPPAPGPQGPQLPRITVTSSPEDIRRAFESVSVPSTPLTRSVDGGDAKDSGSSGGGSGSGAA